MDFMIDLNFLEIKKAESDLRLYFTSIRKSLGLSHYVVDQLAGVSTKTYFYENNPTVANKLGVILLLCKLYGVDLLIVTDNLPYPYRISPNEIGLVRIGEIITRTRGYRSMSRAQLGREVNMNTHSLALIEKGGSMKVANFLAICKVFNWKLKFTKQPQ